LEARKREIDIDLKVQQGDVEIAIHPNLADLYRRKITRLQQALDEETTRPQVIELIRALIDRIEVHPNHERSCKVVVIGAIPQIFAFAQQKAPKNNGTFLMVAEDRLSRSPQQLHFG
jgi:hypothetical protein